MNLDLSDLLRDWPHEPGQINVRLIRAADGEEKIQMRVDLGILQMEVTGRPDGLRPNGFDSLLEYYEAQLDEHVSATGEPEGFSLGHDDSRALREEAALYYHRYVSMLVLGEFQGVVRDTQRNLRAIDFIRDFAEHDEDRELLDQFRPYVTMMRARAIASQAVADSEANAALLALDEGITGVRAIFEEWGRAGDADDSHEIQLLHGMRDELVKKLPSSPKAELRERLQRAIETENYELAAILRDELKLLKD